MDLFSQFSNRNKIVGYTKKPDLLQEKKGNKYLNMRIPKTTVESTRLQQGDLVEALLRNQKGKTEFFKKKVDTTSSSDLKFYVPGDVVDSLGIDENSLVDVFISKD